MQVVNDSFEFGRIKGHLMSDGKTVTLGSPARQAAVFLTGFRTNFVKDDHDFGRLQISLKGTLQPDGVSVRIELVYGLRDKSEDYDDEYSGKVDFCVVADP